MKSRLILSAFTVAAMLAATFALPQSAQAQTRVALIDIGKVFKSHSSFNQQLEALKQEADQFKAESENVRRQLMIRAEELNAYKAGSEKYRSLETELAQEAASMEVEQRNRLREMVTREAELHFATYQQVSAAIDSYCQQRGIQLILRFNSDPMDPAEPNSIMNKVNGSVVYHAAGKDITDDIIQRVRQATDAAARPGATPRLP